MAEADDVPVEEIQKLAIDSAEGVDTGYKAPAKVDLTTIQSLDADDESLVKYKQNLLGQTEGCLDEGGNNVLVKKFTIEITGKDPIDIDLTGDLSKLKKTPLKIPEGSMYRVKITFRVQRDIVSGLRFFSNVIRKGIKVDKNSYMVGSYGPKTEEQIYQSPMEEAPSGMLARGQYKAQCKFTDDDKNTILEWEWFFEIVKK
nr:rho GDP-dissociation inhibitor 1-like [Ciona intestinalis]|eukprot:XP_002126756.1 rho GDP-dissociation inhibitor 1-like [Ciona intestinalis]